MALPLHGLWKLSYWLLRAWPATVEGAKCRIEECRRKAKVAVGQRLGLAATAVQFTGRTGST